MKKLITIAALFLTQNAFSQTEVIYTDTAWYQGYTLNKIVADSVDTIYSHLTVNVKVTNGTLGGYTYDTYDLYVVTPKSFTFYYTEAIFRQKSFALFQKVFPSTTR
jgi:hypothetical protein